MLNMIRNIVKNLIIRSKYPKVRLCQSSRIGIHSVFEGCNNIGRETSFDGYMGYGSYIGEKASILKTKIGRFCSIGNDVSTATGNHPSSVFVSTYPGFFSIKHYNKPCYVKEQKFQEYIFIDDERRYCIVIGNDVWIGNRVLIIGGVTVGDGAIIAAGSVVTKNVAPYSIVCGVPAKELKKRFTEEQIEKLLEIKWWDKSPEWLMKNGNRFENVELFLKEEIDK